MMSTLLGLLPFSILGLSLQVPPPPNDFTHVQTLNNITLRYREVPSGTCELQSGVKSFSGYVDVSEREHIFFWFFETRNEDPKDAPLTAWISGGPGDSSMSELFTENGPCRIDPDGKTLHNNPFSWNNHSNMIYIDQPVHVGFSYTDLIWGYEGDEGIVELQEDDECPDDAEQCGFFSKPDSATTANSTLAAAPTFWLTLQAFMAAFPQYTSNEFHFGSESYGGHYVPVFSKYIEDQNDRNLPWTRRIPLTSIIIGNGWFSPALQSIAYYNYTTNPGNTYDYKPLNDSVTRDMYNALYDSGQCLDQTRDCQTGGDDAVCKAADEFCAEHVENPFLDISERDVNDIRELAPSPFPNEFYSLSYLQRPEVREAIGAYQTYIELNPTVASAFDSTGDDARELGILGILRDLLQKGVHITLYAGDADYECNWLGIEAVADQINAPGYSKAGYADISTSDNIVHGQVKQSGGFSFARIYEAGHATGAFQPLVLQALFARTIEGMDLAKGEKEAKSGYQTQGPPSSTFHEGMAMMQNHTWSSKATYNYTSNKPTLDNFQPTSNRADRRCNTSLWILPLMTMLTLIAMPLFP